MSLKEFLDHNRRTGTTTQLACAAIASRGYLIVESLDHVHAVIRCFPQLQGRVLTVRQIQCGKYPKDKGPVFFDLPATLEGLFEAS